MALPTLEKTWQFNVNNVATAIGSNYEWHRRLMWNLKEALIGFGSNPWVVAGCGDTTGGSGMGVGDLWLSWLNLVWLQSGLHSWIVLENVAGLQVCIDLKIGLAACEGAYFYMSAGGLFLGGDASNRPTATDEINCNVSDGGTYWFGDERDSPPPHDHVWHMWHSEDGEVTRLVGYYQDHPHTIWRFEKFQDPRAGHAIPYGFGIRSGSQLGNQLSVGDQEDNDQMRSDYGGLDMAINPGGAQRTGYNIMERAEMSVPEEIDGEYAFTEIAYLCGTTGGRGPKGKAYDTWWGQYQLVGEGDTYPDDPNARQFVQMGALIFTWTGDATVPLTR